MPGRIESSPIPARPLASTPSQVTVKSGDSLSKLAQRAGVTVDALVQANVGKYPQLATNRNNIQVGWNLEVPGANAQAPAAPTRPTPQA